MTIDPSAIGRYRPDPFQIEQPFPPGMQIPADVQRPANPQPMQHHIRGLIQRLRGQNPTQLEPPPAPPQQQPMRSVLKRQDAQRIINRELQNDRQGFDQKFIPQDFLPKNRPER